MSHQDQVRHDLAALLGGLLGLTTTGEDLPDPGTAEGRSTRQFFRNNWAHASAVLLARTTRIRVVPAGGEFPRFFHFEMDLPYKRKRADGSVELAPGPISGSIQYRSDPFTPRPGVPTVAVLVPSRLGLHHPNYSREYGLLCVGDLPPGPFPLDALLEHVYGILSYQNCDVSRPADLEAARYFATDPHAMSGLDRVPPLYGVEG